MTMRRLWVHSHISDERLAPVLQGLQTWAQGEAVELSYSPSLAGHSTAQPVADLLDVKPDLVVVIGGDGNMLRVAPHTAPLSVPVVGINLGKVGFLADIPADQLSMLSQVVAGGCVIEKRLMLSVCDEKGQVLATALNEICIARGSAIKMIGYDIAIDGELVCQQQADGLVVSTPTGSTAYALSAGGPILYPSMDAMVLVPLCPHRLNTRPVVIPSNQQVKVRCHENNEDVRINVDGHTDFPLNGREVVVCASEHRFHVVIPRDVRFFDTLKTKLHWERQAHVDPSEN